MIGRRLRETRLFGKNELRQPGPNDVARRQGSNPDALVIDRRSIGRPEIDDVIPPVLEDDLEVLGADGLVTDLDGIDLGGVNLYGVDLRGADLSFATLVGADLRGADLRGAQLLDVDLGGADLRGVKVGNAQIIRPNLYGADLSDVNFDEAAIFDLDLEEAAIEPEGEEALEPEWADEGTGEVFIPGTDFQDRYSETAGRGDGRAEEAAEPPHTIHRFPDVSMRDKVALGERCILRIAITRRPARAKPP